MAVIVAEEMVVLEYPFDRWSSMVFLVRGQTEPAASLRKPVGRLQALRQPLYDLRKIDKDWYCKQTADTTDWLGKIASNISNGEPTFQAAASVMAPNVEDGVFGNPEEAVKWILTGDGVLGTQHFDRWHNRSNGTALHSMKQLSLRDYIPKTCPQSGKKASWPHRKSGMVGRHLRVVEHGFWDPDTRCGAAMVAVSPQASMQNATSIALLRITLLEGDNVTVMYLRARANQSTSQPLGVDDLGRSSDEFYQAILSQATRWDAFVRSGAVAKLPTSDVRYRDMPNALMTAYLNVMPGMTPEYGLGKFGNEHNEFQIGRAHV